MPQVKARPVAAANPATHVSHPGASAPAPAAAPATVAHHVKRAAVLGSWSARTVRSSLDAAQLMALRPDADTWHDLIDLQEAALRQLFQLGEAWQAGFAAWTRECAQMRTANTLSKLTEQDFNMIGGFGQLVSQQITDWVTVMEGIQVGCAYWLRQKVSA